MKRKSNDQPLKEVIDEFLRVHRLDKKLAEKRLLNSWEELMGKTIARYTVNLYISDRVFFIYLKSAVLRSELSYKKEQLIHLLNERAGTKVIEDIVFK